MNYTQTPEAELAPTTDQKSSGFEEESWEPMGAEAAQEIRKTILKDLEKRVTSDVFNRWFSSAKIVEADENLFTLEVVDDIHQLWIEANYLQDLSDAVHSVLGMTVQVRIRVADGPSMAEKPLSAIDLAEADARGAEAIAQTENRFEKEIKRARLNAANDFERFVVGTNNQFAHAACQSVAEDNRMGYNPLFIYGESGLGKTHLMQAIGLSRLKSDFSTKIVYLTCEQFTNEFIEAIKARNGLEKFRNRYRKADVLLLDDVQFLAGKERWQEEFFHTFNTLFDSQCQIVLTSDRPASEIKSMSPRLTSRFEAGLTVEMQMPQLETRIAILRRKMDEWKVRLDDSLVSFLAENIKSNVRRLVGGLVRISTYSSLGDTNLTVERVEHLLRDILTEECSTPITIDLIQKTCAEHFDIRLADMTSRRRPANIAFARQVAMYLSRTQTRTSLVDIGEAFGGRDHGTVIHAVKKIKADISKNREIESAVNQLIGKLKRV